VNYPEFADRLKEACRAHGCAPPAGNGLQTWLRKRMGVSDEAVRKWLTGESRPRPDMMHRLADALQVDEAWLALGLVPQLSPKERRVRNALAEGAVNVLLGFMQLDGATVAFPWRSDPQREFVSFYAIYRGVHTPFHVTLGAKIEDQYRFILPPEYTRCTTVGVIRTGRFSVDFLYLATDMIEAHKINKGGYLELWVERQRQRRGYQVTGGGVPVPPFQDYEIIDERRAPTAGAL